MFSPLREVCQFTLALWTVNQPGVLPQNTISDTRRSDSWSRLGINFSYSVFSTNTEQHVNLIAKQ